MDLLHALRDLLTTVNNPVANAAPLAAVLCGAYCVWCGWRAGTSRARHVGTVVCLVIIVYAFTLRTLLQFEVIGTTRFLELSTANVPLVFSAVAYLFYSRTLATQRTSADREIVRQFHEEHGESH